MGYVITKVLPYVGSYSELMAMPVRAVMAISKNVDRLKAEEQAGAYSAVLAAIADALGCNSGFYEKKTEFLNDVIVTEETPQQGAKGVARLRAKLGFK